MGNCHHDKTNVDWGDIGDKCCVKNTENNLFKWEWLAATDYMVKLVAQVSD